MKIIICDRISADRNRCRKMITQLAREHNINVDIQLYDRETSLLLAFDNPEFFVDIIYINIELPGGGGLEVARKLRGQGYQNVIIFMSHSKEYISKGYDVNAFHYIVKNETSKKDFERIFLGAVDVVRSRHQKMCLFTGGGENCNIPIHSIRYFSVDKKTVTIHFGMFQTFDIFVRLGILEEKFKKSGFFRVQRSYLVSLYHIVKINYKEVTISDGTVITIKRGTYKRIKEARAKYLGRV